jgi:hypothetical protein
VYGMGKGKGGIEGFGHVALPPGPSIGATRLEGRGLLTIGLTRATN